VGVVFWDAALAALQAGAEHELPALRGRALVQPRPQSAIEGTAEHVFQHHLLHQVSYETVLPSLRQSAHARAAAWLTESAGDRVDELLAITAQHHERAGQAGQAAQWYARASRQAVAAAAYATARDHCEKALALGEALPWEWRADVLNALCECCDALALRQRQHEVIQALLALAREHGNDRWLGVAWTSWSLLADRLGERELVVQYGRLGAAAAARAGDAARVVLSRGNLAWASIQRGDFEAAEAELRVADEAARLATGQLAGDNRYEVQILLVWSELHEQRGDDVAQGQALAEAVRKAHTNANPRLQTACLAQQVSWRLARADWAEARRLNDALERLSTRLGQMHFVLAHKRHEILLELAVGQPSAAAARATEAADLARSLGEEWEELRHLDRMAEAWWRGGRAADAAQQWRALSARYDGRGEPHSARVMSLLHHWAVHAADGGTPGAGTLQALRQDIQALAAEPQGGEAANAARGWWAAAQVLAAAGAHAESQQTLQRAAPWLARRLAAYADDAVRERVRTQDPWVRAIDQAFGQLSAPPGPPAGDGSGERKAEDRRSR
jgi:hypothetical protein